MKDIRAEIINSTKQVRDLVDWLVFRHEPPIPYSPTMYIDLEGVKLSREGSISIFTLLIDTGIPVMRVCLIDVHTLRAQAFNTIGAKGKTFKDILQDEKIPKVFFDVRNDSDALFAHYGVGLQGVEDVQLMESATRKSTASRKFLSGLAKCVEENVPFSLDVSARASWKLAKERGERLFKAANGGSYEIFNQRPISDDIISYCVADVRCLPGLRERFWSTRTLAWRDLVKEESNRRVALSQKPEYQPHGRDKAMSPWNKDQNDVLDAWNYVPPPRDYFDDCFDFYDDEADDNWFYDQDDNDFEDWTRMPWQGPPS